MAKCKFNDYTLPEPPAGWNQTTHTHAMIVEQKGTMTFNLVVHSTPLSVRVVDGVECIGFDPGAEVLGWAYTRGDDWVWTAMGEAPEAEDGLTWRYYKPDKIAWVWCNHDICDESGAVVYAASEPVPVEEPQKFPLKSWLLGLALALAGNPRLLAKREPVAWLYNGVPLPDIYKVYTPEVQEEFPHAAITDNGTETSYFLYLFSEYRTMNDFTSMGQWYSFNVSKPILFAKCNVGDTAWSELIDFDILYPDNSGFELGGIKRYFVWTNTDLSFKGILAYAATDPVPIYE